LPAKPGRDDDGGPERGDWRVLSGAESGQKQQKNKACGHVAFL
jgi:hypothetical protein